MYAQLLENVENLKQISTKVNVYILVLKLITFDFLNVNDV